MWKKGQSGNPTGRPKGTYDIRTLEIRDFSRNMIEDRAYQQRLHKRLIAGTAPHMEPLLFHYAYGKPVDKVAMTTPDGGEPMPRSPLWDMTKEQKIAFIDTMRAYLAAREEDEPPSPLTTPN